MTPIIQAVFFDFDNTLVDYVRSDTAALSRLADLVRVDADQFVDRAVQHIMAFHALYDRGEARPKDMNYYRLSNTLKDFGVAWKQEYLDLYLDCYLNNPYVFPGVPEMLGQLKVFTGLISNAYLVEEQRLRIQRSGLGQYFDDILICGEVGLYKPAPQAFWYLTDKHGLTPENCIYVGDSETHDVRGANDAGFISVKVAPRSGPNSQADYICENIHELTKLLGKLIC